MEEERIRKKDPREILEKWGGGRQRLGRGSDYYYYFFTVVPLLYGSDEGYGGGAGGHREHCELASSGMRIISVFFIVFFKSQRPFVISAPLNIKTSRDEYDFFFSSLLFFLR